MGDSFSRSELQDDDFREQDLSFMPASEVESGISFLPTEDVIIVASRAKPHTVVFASPSFSQMTGFKKGKRLGVSFIDLFESRDNPEEWNDTLTRLPAEHAFSFSASLLRANDQASPVPVEVHVTSLSSRVAHLDYFIAVIRNAQGQGHSKKTLDALFSEIMFRALHDRLTGLPNRFYFDQQIKLNLKQAKLHKKRIGIVLIDLDNFKEINDAFGHKTGDLLLQKIVNRIKKFLNPREYMVRWGGDEFLLIIPELESEDSLISRFVQLQKSVRDVGAEGPRGIELTISIGYAIYPDHGRSIDQLIQLADYAMYQVKNSGKNNYFTGALESRQLRRNPAVPSVLFQRLNASLKSENIRVAYQPVWNLESGAIRSIGCLLRWNDRRLGEVPPSDFIGYAERNGLIVPLGYALMEQSFARLQSWHTLMPGLRLSINLSPPQMLAKDLLQKLGELCHAYRISPDHIVFEVTERQSFLDRPIFQSQVRMLRELGFHLTLDDFGVGYSNFETLYQLPFGAIKVDKSIVKNAQEPKGARVLRAIAQLANGLGMDLIAEGVETKEISRAVEEQYVFLCQGFYFTPPCDAGEILRILQERWHPPLFFQEHPWDDQTGIV